MPRKENTKAKSWERDRRERMNTYFKTLADLLPPRSQGRKLNKVDILIHASKYIKDLHNRAEELFSTHASEAHKEELIRLKKLVTQLMSRTQLLSTLLKEAGISVPAEPALEKICPLKWSNKINVDVDIYFDKIKEKKTVETKKKEKSVKNKVPSKKKTKTSSAPKKLSKEAAVNKNVCNSIENQENRVNCANSKNYNTDNTSSVDETGSKETDHSCQNDSINEATATSTTKNTKKKTAKKKIESQKALKKRSKAKKSKDKKKSTSPPVVSTVTNLTPNTLIFSNGKLMPLVAPMTSNIIVNAQQTPTNPIILGSTQQSQMIVMQPLANRVPNSVVSICNHALINTMQKVTLNTVPTIHANMVVDSQSSNVKNMINTTKIGSHKNILPKNKEITKTTMAYKMPIPAVHKEKPKDSAIKKESEVKKSCKSHSKNHKSVPNTPEAIEENVEKKSSKENTTKSQEDSIVARKTALKRALSAESVSAGEPEDKKRKEMNDEVNIATRPIVSKASDFTVTCKSIESLKYVIEKIGEDIRDEHVATNNEKETAVTESNSANDAQVTNDASNEKTSKADKLINIVDANCLEMDKETTEVMSRTVVSDKPPNELRETDAVDQSSNNFNVSIDNIAEKNDENAEHLSAKSTLTDIDVAEKAVGSDESKKTCNLGKRFDNLLRVATAKEHQQVNDAMCTADSNKIILNLDTNTTTTMKSDAGANAVDAVASVPISSSALSSSSSSSSSSLTSNVINDETKLTKISKDEMSKSLSYTSENTFIPIGNRTDGLHSDLSNDIFASLQVPSSSHNSESISPTAAFLMSFPLVSSLNGKTEVLDEDMKEDFKYHSQTPPMLLQIGTIEPNSFKIKTSSPSHAIAEKRLKTSCEEKQAASTNTGIIAPAECSTTKSLPKVMSEEMLREPYKIVQTVLTSSLQKPVTTTSSFFSHTSVSFSTVDSSCISSSLAANQSRPDQLTTTNALNNVNVISSQASQVNISASTDKSNIADCVSQGTTNRNPDVAYSGAPNFLPNYSTAGNSLETSQHTPSSYKNAITTSQNPISTSVVSRIENTDGSQNLLGTRLDCATVTTNSSSAALRSFQVDYSDQGKNKGSQGASHVTYPSHNKVALINSSGIVSDHRVDYASQIDRSLPATSQSLPNYSSTKECSLPTFSSQHMQPVYNQALNDSQQFTVHKKQEHIIANSHDYVQAKTISQKDSISYTNGETNETTSASSRNQDYVTKTASQENPFQQSYMKLSKSTDTSDNPNQPVQKTKLNGVLNSKSQEQQQQQRHNHIRDSAYVPAKKVDVDSFVQSFQYDVKETMSNTAERTNVLNADGTHNNYVSYTSSKDDKKTNAVASTNTMVNSNKSTAVQQTVVPRYSQQTSSLVTTSNYEQSTMTESHAKSTTTVAHNSSNFSILSWTTFSPVSGSGGGSNGGNNNSNNNNNNLMHFDQVQPHQNDNTEAKTICENYNYIPLHKENASFPNQVLISDDYPTVPTGIDKLRQGKIEPQKQPFVDTSKTRNDPSKQQNRMQSQQTGSDYKFTDSGKSKNKYTMNSDYNLQNEYNTMNQQPQQHGPKTHQSLSSKQEKMVYTYEPHNFDLAESNVQMKYSIEAYTGANFKYAEKTQQPGQHKYQTLAQGQISVLPHNNGSYNSSDVKHSQQQQQQSHSNNNSGNNNKSKGNQHPQHAVKAPVNWMMTPEVKHNSANITDIILPPIGKELDFCQNNLFTQTPTYNQGTPNQFYNNYDAATAHSFPNLPVLQSDPKRSAETFYSEEQPFPWSPTKNSVHNSVEHVIGQSSIKCIDQHIVPSSLQSLVSDLDLSANLTEKQNFLFAAATPSSRISAEQSKDASIKEKEANNVSGRDLHAILNTQNAQHPASTFLSVSQLVEQEKAEKNHHQQHHQHHHPHPPQHSQQQQQQQQQQARKHQRKSNTSPRTTSKRQQMDIRKSTTTNDLHQRHEEQKSSGPVFTEQNYQQSQQQKYHQNNVHWRSRNCNKSNYTAEALIGTSVHDTGGHQDKHASIKFTSNYPQNKFQNGLSAAASVDTTVMPINYFSSAPPSDDGTAAGYGQSVVNQNFNTYAYSSSSANSIYPTGNFITSIPTNTSNSYMGMQLHENTADYTVQETNSFLLPNMGGTSSSSSVNTSSANTISTTANANGKNHQHYGKHPNCDKRSYSTAAKKGKRKSGFEAGPMQNLAEFPLSGITSPLEDYHHHSATFLPPPPPPPPPPHVNPLYQNHSQTNVYVKTVNGLPPPPPPSAMSAQGAATSFSMNSNMVRGGIVSSNPMAMPHHPSGTSLTNFNLTTIFPEMNDKVTGYKPSNGIPSGLSQTASNQIATYTQRSNYPSNSLGHLPQPCL